MNWMIAIQKKEEICSWLLALFLLLGVSACDQKKEVDPIFELLSPKQSGIDFNNEIIEDEAFHMYEFMNIYTGGGVAVGDVNNDGREDIFFSGNRVSSRLYLNKGSMQFEDVTKKAGLETDRWCAGATMMDVNLDGWLDIYVSVSGSGEEAERRNLLYINQGDTIKAWGDSLTYMGDEELARLMSDVVLS
ncbi:MAG: VCBS repeat-containing protein, partial [Bacteroidota bacterium]